MIDISAAPPRGFPTAEYEQRFDRMQQYLGEAGLAGMLLTLPEQVRWITGFHTQLMVSPTRPWYVVVPARGPKPIAVIPTAGASGMAATWVDDIRTWQAPAPADDGVTLLADALASVAGAGRIGAEFGHELHLRMPMVDFERIRALSDVEIVDGTSVVRRCRHVKSELEIDKIRFACLVASKSYEAIPGLYEEGDSERTLVQKYRVDVIRNGADHSPFLVGSAGPRGYGTITMGPTDRVLSRGDVLFIDTGTMFDGYFCDFDRNWSFGPAEDAIRGAYDAAWVATEAGISAAQPGATCAQVWAAMDKVLREAGSLGNNAGRFGHGLGLQLTEPPSNLATDETVLELGTVLTIEPGLEFAPGRMMVHEENIVIRDGPAELLSVRAAREIPVIG